MVSKITNERLRTTGSKRNMEGGRNSEQDNEQESEKMSESMNRRERD